MEEKGKIEKNLNIEENSFDNKGIVTSTGEPIPRKKVKPPTDLKQVTKPIHISGKPYKIVGSEGNELTLEALEKVNVKVGNPLFFLEKQWVVKSINGKQITLETNK